MRSLWRDFQDQAIGLPSDCDRWNLLIADAFGGPTGRAGACWRCPKRQRHELLLHEAKLWADCSYSCYDWGQPAEFRNRVGVMVCGTPAHLPTQCCRSSGAFQAGRVHNFLESVDTRATFPARCSIGFAGSVAFHR